ncbi:helix-turn-helix domain-containing protein [Streptomyces odonnellii]|uniref:helix-turn-helix domain-containing protein n=1 Tax=Streptomyces odonnellii TaxID=1417980 RepID=UPI0007C825F3|nr:helix-turn-helix transcriptional regulator [Streptomyces odonnellii]
MQPKPLDTAPSVHALIGAELRYQREKKEMSQSEVGRLLFLTGAFIGMLESGTRRMRPEIAIKLDEILDSGGYFFRVCAALKDLRQPDQSTEAVKAEQSAKRIQEYAPQHIPGILQTKAYAQAALRSCLPTAAEEAINELITPALERAKMLQHPEPTVWTVLDEAVLQRMIGGPAVMAEALRHIAELGRRRRIVVQVLPFAAGGHPAIDGALKLMAFSDAPTLAYLKCFASGQLVDDPAAVAQYEFAFSLIGASADSHRVHGQALRTEKQTRSQSEHGPAV